MAYATSDDLDQYIRKIPTASGVLDKDTFIANAATEINTAGIGLYKLPFEILSSVDAATSGVTSDILNIWNAKLGAGYLILAATISQENEAVHAYGKMLVDQVLDELERVKEQKIVLIGATADTTLADNKIKPVQALNSSPDGEDSALDDKSFFNRSYDEIGNPDDEVTGGPDL